MVRIPLHPLSQAAVLAQTPIGTLTALARRGEIASVRIAGKLYLREDDLKRVRKERTAKPPPPPLTQADLGGGLLTPGEVAKIFRVGTKTVAKWARRGQIQAIQTLGGQYRYPADQFREMLRDGS